MSTEPYVLVTPEGQAALAQAMGESDPSSLGAATRLRRHHDPELAAAALTQASLRRAARTKFGDRADQLYFTATGLEQATRQRVATWRAERLRAMGVTHVIDLGCGIGADCLAFLDAGMQVSAVERDPLTASIAQANLPSAEVVCADACEVASSLVDGASSSTAVFLDPARRTGAGRTWKVADVQPPWAFVTAMMQCGLPTVVKMGPGMPTHLIEPTMSALWVSDDGDVVEAGLWSEHAGLPARGAIRLPGREVVPGDSPAPPVGNPGLYICEPDGAAIRARALGAIAPQMWALHEGIAYLTCDDEPEPSPWYTRFRVDEAFPYRPKALKAWVRAHGIGTLEIKKRGIDIDPAQLRRQLGVKGSASATIIVSPTSQGAMVFVVTRLPSSAA